MSTLQEHIKVKMTKTKTYDISVERYLSAQEVVNDCRNRSHRHSQYDISKKKFSDRFEGVRDYNEALELLKLGYQPTVEKLKSALKANVLGNGKRITFENNIHGFAPIVPLALKGIPNSMLNMTMKPIKCKVVDVYYDMGVSFAVNSDTIITAGQKLLGTIIELEKQGYKFNLYAMQGYSGDSTADILCVKVKSSDKPIDLKRISFPLTHPAFFRVIGFDWQGKSPITRYRGAGRGMALTDVITDEKAKDFAKQAFGDNAVYISCNSIKRKDEEYIKEVLVG